MAKRKPKREEFKIRSDFWLTKGVVYGLFATLVIITLAYSPYTYYYDGVKYYFLVGGIAFLGIWVSLWFLRTGEGLNVVLWKDDLTVLGLLLFSLLSLIKTNNILVSLRLGIFLFLYIFMFYLWRRELRNDESWFDKLENLVAILGFLVGGYIILQYYGIYIWIGKGDGSPPTLYSTMGHQNFAAGYAATAFPFLLIKFLKGEGWRRWLWGSFTIIQSLGIYLTQSREGFAAWAIAIFSIIWFAWRGGILYKALELKKRIGVILTVAVLVFAIYYLPSPLTHGKGVGKRVFGTVEQLAEGMVFQATSGRNLIWKATLKMIKENPILGVGLGRFNYHYIYYQADFLKDLKGGVPLNAGRTHNEYLQVFAETGIGGFLSFMLFLYFLYKRLVLLIKVKGERNLGYLAVASGISAGLTSAFFSFPFRLPAHGPLIVILFSTAFGLSDDLLSAWKSFKVEGKWRIALVFIPLLSISSWVFYYNIHSFRSQVLSARCFVLMSRDKSPKFINEVVGPMAGRAVQLDPTERMAQFALARAYMLVGNWPMAEKEWKRFFEIETDWNAMINYSIVLVNLRKLEEAERVAREIVRVQPQLVEGYNILGGLLVEKGKFDEAEPYLKKATEIDPKNPVPYYNLGYLYYKKGDSDKALLYLEEAQKRNPPGDLAIKIRDLRAILTSKASPETSSTASTSPLPNIPKEVIDELLRKRGR
ncbi:MAG: tetratricopeptide repeat protein [Synergistetes bacterium]|nr:tetratricopeptide repeat protein [Synergistota bacterium]MDW8193107.1 tetratricopeptide repeat protein [Synergistota bacterium]